MSATSLRYAMWLGQQSVEPPKSAEVRGVESPIPEHAADKMTDAQWLSAIARYSSDEMRAIHSGELVGGAYELAHLLEAHVKKEPARFVRLACKFPGSAHPAYFDAVLRGITDVDLDDMQLILDVCIRCHRLSKRP